VCSDVCYEATGRTFGVDRTRSVELVGDLGHTVALMRHRLPREMAIAHTEISTKPYHNSKVLFSVSVEVSAACRILREVVLNSSCG
jgi:hypothetical protein